MVPIGLKFHIFSAGTPPAKPQRVISFDDNKLAVLAIFDQGDDDDAQHWLFINGGFIKNMKSNLTLTVDTNDGVALKSFKGDDSQVWKVDGQTIIHINSNKVLSVMNGSVDTNAILIVSDDVNADHQRWRLWSN